jgi:hypothetical protein
MIHELRIYTFKPGGAAIAAKAAATIGKDIRGDNYGKLLGYWNTEIGALNRGIHLWEHESYEKRKQLRAEMGKLPRWVNEYVPVIQGDAGLQRQDIRFLNPIMDIKKPASAPNLYELRTYRLKPGAVGQWLANFKAALPVREKYSPLNGLWSGEAGQPNEVLHLWSYKSFEERMKVREQVSADKEWQATVQKNRPLLESQESVLLLPAAHSPLK